ncbi:putative bifunctional diguanylate cyclase/phosphodiesterase [Aurantiacibacter luteus]|uniref:putative bifunctional diguanylate cyclase/phosphodiesterase n=1 Tax=Aurantiacibacter luteus TaxID=1581420 RepID=UPI0009E55B86|nr:EAL domain-containing protein [Aurantiacibacter luteus]
MRLLRDLDRVPALCRSVPRRLLVAQALLLAAPMLAVALTALGVPHVLLLAAIPVLVLGLAGASLAVLRHFDEQQDLARASQDLARSMREQAQTDTVTGLANRVGLEAAMEPFATDLPLGEKVALLWLDLRRFKEVNDGLGHQIGDKVLQEVASRLREAAPEDAVLARFASDEFVLAARLPSLLAAQEMAGRIAERVSQPVRINGHRIGNGVSIGVAMMPDDAIAIPRLMQAADLALYHAKRGRANEVRFFHDSMTRALARRKEIEADLRTAIQRDELSIFFQPIIDLASGRIRGFEALVRWFHPDKGELLPAEFIPIAEESGLIITLGNWITGKAAQAAATWPDDITLAVNLSAAQIKAPGAALGILAALREARLNPARLELELTESLFIDDDENTAAFMTDLATEGVGFSLDDFGTGYSSLRYIHLHPFRTIKVDRSFVSGANTGRRSDAIIRAVAELGSTLDMHIVAEGLETIEQVQAVKAAGCTLGQGYYFSRAVPDYMAALLLTQEREEHAQTIVAHPRRKAG